MCPRFTRWRMFLSANRYPPSDQVRGHASPGHALVLELRQTELHGQRSDQGGAAQRRAQAVRITDRVGDAAQRRHRVAGEDEAILLGKVGVRVDEVEDEMLLESEFEADVP